MSQTILVTGATGNVGSQLVKQLSEAGQRFRVAVHSKKSVDGIDPDKAEFVELDFNKPETVKKAFEGVAKLFFITPVVPDVAEVAAPAVAAAKNAGVKHIVRLSAMGADMEPGVTLGRAHRQVEKMIEDSGVSFTHLRPTSFMQNYVHFSALTVKEQNVFYQPIGDGKVPSVDTRDIAAVALAALTNSRKHADKAYEITGPEASIITRSRKSFPT